MRSIAKDFGSLLLLERSARLGGRIRCHGARMPPSLSPAEQAMRLDLDDTSCRRSTCRRPISRAWLLRSKHASRCSTTSWSNGASSCRSNGSCAAARASTCCAGSPTRYLPREIVERPKQGFGVPIDRWLRGPLRSWARERLEDRRLYERFPLDRARVAAAPRPASLRQARHPSAAMGGADARAVRMSVLLIDALSARRGGGQTYLRNLLTRLPAGEPARIYVLARPEDIGRQVESDRVRVRAAALADAQRPAAFDLEEAVPAPLCGEAGRIAGFLSRRHRRRRRQPARAARPCFATSFRSTWRSGAAMARLPAPAQLGARARDARRECSDADLVIFLSSMAVR